MSKVKRMNTARIVVLTIAVGAGGIAAYLASGSDNKPPTAPVAQLQTVDVLVAKSDIGLGQSLTPREESGPRRFGRHRQFGGHPCKCPRSCDRSDPEGKRRPERRDRQDGDA